MLPVEHGALPQAGRPPALPVEHGAPPAKHLPPPRETPAGPAKSKPRPAAPKPQRKVPAHETTLPGSAAEQAAFLRKAMAQGDDQQLRRAISRLFLSGPARTTKVLMQIPGPQDRRLLIRTLSQVGENRQRALEVYDQLRRRGRRPCAVAVLYAAAHARPRDVQGLVDHLREAGQDGDAQLLLAAAAWLPGAGPTPALTENVAHVLRYTSHRVTAERHLARQKKKRKAKRQAQKQAQAQVAAKAKAKAQPKGPGRARPAAGAAAPPAAAAADKGRAGWWSALVRLLAALFRRRG
ncbi:hypothetical protein [Streptomyces sp. Ru71]|uniref:hypothetical protein n=1 Tax=Streptomyces sp. Ru71 TaxID=2080746 RepID=UPI0011B0F2C8|nr:hypothetical protein [Streptomyces sp. Ru71]